MGLRKQKGNMYAFVTHTWNPIRGRCLHKCTYCYMNRWDLKPVRLDEYNLRTNLGEGKFIFIGSGTDMFANNVPSEWIKKVLEACIKYPGNRYLFQTKNTARLKLFSYPDNTVLGTTIETNRWYEAMGNTVNPFYRGMHMSELNPRYDRMVTIEPVMDFDTKYLVELIDMVGPKWVNLGADSGGNKLPEPTEDKIRHLIAGLEVFTEVKLKKNLKRLYPEMRTGGEPAE